MFVPIWSESKVGSTKLLVARHKQSNAILINVFRPPLSQKNVDKKGNFSEILVKTKTKSVSTKLLGLFTKSVDLPFPEVNG